MDIDRTAFHTGIPVIDRQHDAYIDMVQRLMRRCEKKSLKPSQIHAEVKEVVRYAVEHFDDEERLMRSINYPAYKTHLEKHDQFRVRLDGFLHTLKHGGIDGDYGAVLTDWLIGWLEQQVKHDDAKLAAYLKSERR